MAYTTAITTTKANVEALITALTGSETIDELLIINKAAEGLNCSNYGVLETAIETLIDTQTSATDHTDILLASRMLGQTQARTHVTYETHTVTSSNASFPVPAGAVECLVTYGSAGGDSYGTVSSNQRSAGGGGGSKVVDFPIGVTEGGTLSIVKGTTTTIGNVLVITSGSNGGDTYGGDAGTVAYLGEPQIEGPTVILGGAGGDAGEDGGDAGGFSGGVGGNATYGGGGGGASYGGGGGDGGSTQYHQGEATESIYGSGAGGDGMMNSPSSNLGGMATNITLQFKIVTVV